MERIFVLLGSKDGCPRYVVDVVTDEIIAYRQLKRFLEQNKELKPWAEVQGFSPVN